MRRVLVAGCAALLAACGGGSEDGIGGGTVPETDGTYLSVVFSTGWEEVDRLDWIPDYVLHTDGTLFFETPPPVSEPGPLLPEIRSSTLPDDSLHEIARLIGEIRLDGFDERASVPDTDALSEATTAVFSIHDGAGVHIYTVNGFDRSQRDPDVVRLVEIVGILDGVAAAGSAPYSGDRLQVLAGALLGIFADHLTTQAEWPLDIEFSEMTDWALGQRCAVLEGEAAESARALFAEADEGFEWGPDQLRVRARPLLPGEDGCAEAPESLRNAPLPTAPPTTVS
jgi:hypothetical protein